MARQRQHIVQRYEDDLLRLRSLMEQMGGLVEHQLSLMLAGLAGNDTTTALEAVAHDRAVDGLEHEVETQAIRLLALRGPMAGDLREIVAAIPMAGALERMGDHTSSIARRLETMEQPVPRSACLALHAMGRLVLEHLRHVMDALARKDAAAARAIWQEDQLVDRYGEGLTRDYLAAMTREPRTIRLHIALLFIVRNLERIGDHTTNLAERVVFMVTGTMLPSTRPHGHDRPAPATADEAPGNTATPPHGSPSGGTTADADIGSGSGSGATTTGIAGGTPGRAADSHPPSPHGAGTTSMQEKTQP